MQLMVRSVNTESHKMDALGTEQLDHTMALAIAIAQESDDEQKQQQKVIKITKNEN